MADHQSTLRDTLGVVRKRIQQIRERKETVGEQNTKAALIYRRQQFLQRGN
jgi:fructose-1,6-bisphosphatase